MPVSLHDIISHHLWTRTLRAGQTSLFAACVWLSLMVPLSFSTRGIYFHVAHFLLSLYKFTALLSTSVRKPGALLLIEALPRFHLILLELMSPLFLL